MPGAATKPDDLYTSPNLIFAARRQASWGIPATNELIQLLETQVSPDVMKEVASLGIEVGVNSINQQEDVAQLLNPTVGFNGHMRVGAHMMILAMRGYFFISQGTQLDVPITTTLAAAITSQFTRVALLTDPTGIAAGDWVQFAGPTVSGNPVRTDQGEVKEVAAVGPQSTKQRLRIVNASGGTFLLYVQGVATVAIAHNAAAAAIQAALETVVGAGLITATAVTGGFDIDWISTEANKFHPLITADITNLVGTDAAVVVSEITPGAAANQIVLKHPLNEPAYQNGAAVSKVLKNGPVDHWGYHASPDDPRVNTAWSIYLEWGNRKHKNRVIFYDGLAPQFNYSAQVRSIPTFQAQLNCINFNRKAQVWQAVTKISDPSPVALQNTRGGVEVLGNIYDLPTSLNINNAGTVFDDARISSFTKLALIHTDHAVTASYAGMFARDLWDLILFGGASFETVTDAIAKGAFKYTAQSPVKIGSSNRYYTFEVEFPSAQFSNYKAEFNTSNPVTGGAESVKVVNETDNTELFRYHFVNKCTSDVVAA